MNLRILLITFLSMFGYSGILLCLINDLFINLCIWQGYEKRVSAKKLDTFQQEHLNLFYIGMPLSVRLSNANAHWLLQALRIFIEFAFFLFFAGFAIMLVVSSFINQEVFETVGFGLVLLFAVAYTGHAMILLVHFKRILQSKNRRKSTANVRRKR